MNRTEFLNVMEANAPVTAKREPFLACKADIRRTQYVDEFGTGFEILSSYGTDVAYLDLIRGILFVSKIPSATSSQHIRKYAQYNNVKTIVYMCQRRDKVFIWRSSRGGVSYEGHPLPKKVYDEIVSHDYAEVFEEVMFGVANNEEE